MGWSTAIWKISDRFFSPPERSLFTERSRKRVVSNLSASNLDPGEGLLTPYPALLQGFG